MRVTVQTYSKWENDKTKNDEASDIDVIVMAGPTFWKVSRIASATDIFCL